METSGKIFLAGLAVVGTICLYLSALLLPYWIFGSVVTSGIKAVAKDCGKSYGIERTFIQGDWFCP